MSFIKRAIKKVGPSLVFKSPEGYVSWIPLELSVERQPSTIKINKTSILRLKFSQFQSASTINQFDLPDIGRLISHDKVTEFHSKQRFSYRFQIQKQYLIRTSDKVYCQFNTVMNVDQQKRTHRSKFTLETHQYQLLRAVLRKNLPYMSGWFLTAKECEKQMIRQLAEESIK